jgi:hypothetical protein
MTREVFRYCKDKRTRVYGLKSLSADTSELWVRTEDERGKRTERKLVTIDDEEDVEPFLGDVRRELRAGGWTEVGAKA